MLSNLVTSIGLEVHIQVKARTKIFCQCPVVSSVEDIPPNAASCPICQGHPGVLPALNPRVVELAINCALALNCQVQQVSTFDRKHYFYPDIPKNYQVTQNLATIGKNGHVFLPLKDGVSKKIRIAKIHMEEDAGSLKHATGSFKGKASYVNFNRCGVPLLEIVSHPDIESPEEAKLYLQKIQQVVRWFGISNADMEKGEMRCDANVSVRPKDTKISNSVKWEIKNVNSHKFVMEALKQAQSRQTFLLKQSPNKLPSDILEQQTFGWDSDALKLVAHRSKESADDYFYFVEPDLMDVHISNHEIAKFQQSLPEHPDEAQKSLINLNLPTDWIHTLTESFLIFRYFQKVIRVSQTSPRTTANLMIHHLLPSFQFKDESQDPLPATQFGQIIRKVEDGELLAADTRHVIKFLMDNGGTADSAILALNLSLTRVNTSEIEERIHEVIQVNKDAADSYRSGNTKIIGFLVGEVMKQYQSNKPNPVTVRKSIEKALEQTLNRGYEQ